MKIPVADPCSDLTISRADLVGSFAKFLDSGTYILGPAVRSFETAWAQFCGVSHAVGVSSGTDGLALALRAVGVGPGDEVVVPAMTALATWMAVSQIGARPIGADVDPVRRTIDPECVRSALTDRTRAIVAVHLYGQPADMDALALVAAEAKVPLVEDAAQAHAAKLNGRVVGSLADAAAFSFYPTKNLGALGDAGAVTTDRVEVAEQVRRLRQYGWRSGQDSAELGVNARLDELQAVILEVRLAQLESATARRRAIASRYLTELAHVPGLELPRQFPQSEAAWHLFAVCHPRRAEMRAQLDALGVGTGIHYDPAPARTTVFANSGGRFPAAERHAATTLSLPLYPSLTEAQVDRVIAAVMTVCLSL